MGESSTGRAQPLLLTWPHWGVAKSCVPLHSRDDERGDAYGELKVRRAVCGASPATKEPWRGHIPSLSVILFLLVGAFYTLYSFCMMVILSLMSPFNRILSANQRCAPSRLSLTLHGVSSLRDLQRLWRVHKASGRGSIYTVTLWIRRVWQESSGMCVYLRGGKAGLALFAFGLLSLR